MKALGLNVLFVPQGNEIPRWSLMLIQSLILYSFKLEALLFPSHGVALSPKKKGQKSFDLSGFRIQPFTKHVFVTNNSRVPVPKSRKGFILK
jgi:hypothetical protein